MIDRKLYFDSVRASLFGGALSQEQVDGQNVILALWEYQAGGTPMTDTRWLAYMLATTYHECATKMWPIEEFGQGQGRPYGEPDPETGQVYYGRGFVQLTWKDNYDKASGALALIDDRDLVKRPQLALDSLIAARVLFRGMAEGWFTGRKLGDYFNDVTDDPVNARQIINANDDDTLIAGYHQYFLAAVQAALPAAVDFQPVTSDHALSLAASDVLFSLQAVGQAVDALVHATLAVGQAQRPHEQREALGKQQAARQRLDKLIGSFAAASQVKPEPA